MVNAAPRRPRSVSARTRMSAEDGVRTTEIPAVDEAARLHLGPGRAHASGRRGLLRPRRSDALRGRWRDSRAWRRRFSPLEGEAASPVGECDQQGRPAPVRSHPAAVPWRRRGGGADMKVLVTGAGGLIGLAIAQYRGKETNLASGTR